MHKILTFVAAAGLAGAAMAAVPDNLCGALSFDNNSTTCGVYNLSTREALTTWTDQYPFNGTYYDGNYFVAFHLAANGKAPVVYSRFNATTWEKVAEDVTYAASESGKLPYAVTYDPSQKTIFACFYQQTSGFQETDDAQFGYLDFGNSDPVTIIGTLPVRMHAMAFDGDGLLYGYGFDNGFYSINKSTGAATKLSEITLPVCEADAEYNDAENGAYGRESMAWNPADGCFYLSYGDYYFDTYIAKIDPTAYTATLVADYSLTNGTGGGDVITGLYFKQEAPVTVHVAPEAITDFAVSPKGTDLTATATFTMPAKDVKGNSLIGQLEWRISDGNKDLAKGQAAAGTSVTASVPVGSQGNYTFSIYVAVGDAESTPATASAFVGCDTPVISGLPTAVASADGSSVKVSWRAATAKNGGNMADLVYEVVRTIDGTVVGSTSETNITDYLPTQEKQLYSYLITPTAGIEQGETVTSRSCYGGVYFPVPYADSFTDEALFLQYPVIDGNGDGNLWEINTTMKAAFINTATSAASNDYLLIGPFRMEAGASYTLAFTAGGHTPSETVAAYAGQSATDPSAYVEVVAPTTVIPSEGTKNLRGSFEPAEAGDYYFAIKACSPASRKMLYVYDVNVTGVTSACPAEPTAVSHELGATSCTITLTCPSKTLGGATIDALTGVNIYRDGELLATVTAGVAPGKTVSYEDASEVSTGVHTYSVAAVSAAGEGKRASFDAYRGLDIPGAVTNLRVWEDAKESGTIHITFDYPETGLNGGYYDRESAEWLADYTYYSTWEGEIVNLGSGNDLTYKHSAGFPSQDIFAVSVYGQNATGNGRTVRRTRSCVVGPALSLPVRESWSGGSLATIWTGQDIDDQQEAFSCYWEVRNGDVTLSAQDSDYGLFALTAAKDGVSKRALGPRISLKGASKPFMSFYYAYSTAATALDLEILVDDQPVKTIQALSVDPANAGKWQRVEVDLTPYKDSEYIEVAFGGYANEGTEAILIDNVTFADQLESDLAVVSFEGPEKVDVNSAATFALTLRNNTPNAVKAADYTIDLYKNGALLGQYKGVDLAGEARVSASLQDTPIVTDPALCEYFVELNFIDDQDKSNNKSSAVSVRVVGNDYPTVTDLQGSYDAARGVVLSWSDPSTASLPRVPSTESWESLTCYSISEFGDWTVFDGDGAKTVTPGTVFGSLNYEHVGEPMAWQVIDTNESYLYFWSSAFEARTGSKLLSSFQASGTACLDYLISPELAGDAQTISFYAACASPALGGNVFMVMTSSTDNEPSSFTALATDQTVSEKSWTEYRYELPAGTRYFAIVNVSTGQAAMLIDDVTFAGVNSAALSLELQGFNVYRDGQRLNSDLVAENEYVDATVEAGKSYTYHVTPLWDKGEAPVSNAATVAAESGISSVGAQEAPVEYYDLRGCRVRGQLTPGIYIRRQGAVATKILVK